MSDSSETLKLPALDWPDAKLLQYLADAWGMPDPGHIRVIGRFTIAGAGNYGFLKDLHNATTGVKLPSLAHISKLDQGVFVAGPDVESLSTPSGHAAYAEAELELSPLFRRQEKGDPLACVVRPNSIMALSRVLESWGTKSIEGEKAPLMLDMAREAIKARLQQDTAEIAQQMERARHAHVQQREKQEADLQEAKAKQQALSVAIEQADAQLRAVRETVDVLNTDFDLRRQILEKKLRDLETLLHERGERLVALDLVDRNDLTALTA